MKSLKVEKIVEIVPRKLPISVIAGLFAIVVFWTSVLTSIALYPGIFNPNLNWMSNLGSCSRNPNGHVYFNIGCIISGIAMFPFFIGLYEWYIGGKRNKILTILVQVAGFYTGIAMIMVGLYPIDYSEMHTFWSMNLFTITVFTFIFPSIALYKYKFTRNIARFGILATIVNLILWFWLNPLMEWITIIFSFCFIGIIIISMQRRIDRLRLVREQKVVIPSKKKRKNKK